MKIGRYILLNLASVLLLQSDSLLPKNVLIEQYLISAQRYDGNEKYEKACKEFQKIESLQKSLPDDF